MILVVGSTGFLGSEICRQLAAKQLPVRAMVRPTSAPEKVEHLKSLGAEIVIGDLKDPASLAKACQGVEKVISTASSTISRQADDHIENVDRQGQLDLVAAAKDAGVGRFVFISFKETPDCPLNTAKRAVEKTLADSGMIWSSLQANYFMEVWLSPAIGFNYPERQATLYGAGDKKISWVAIKDVATFAVAALDHPLATNRVLDIGGPEALSPNEVVRIFEKVGGQPFTVQHVPEAALSQQWSTATDSLQKSFSALMLAYAWGNEMDMTETVRQIPVRQTSVEDYARAVSGVRVS